MTLGIAEGNGNRASWRDVMLVDGTIYRLPNGQLVRASVVPHPDALPQFWRDTPDGSDAWPIGHDLNLSIEWFPKKKRVLGTAGPAQVTLFSAASIAGAPWGEDFFVYQLGPTPTVLPASDDTDDVDEEQIERGWRVDELTAANKQEESTFASQVRIAETTLKRLAMETAAA